MKLILANWKMNPSTLAEAKDIFLSVKRSASKIKKITIVICPPFLFIESLRKLSIPKISLGAQDVHYEISNIAQTGEISPIQLYEAGIKYVLIGHSERRALGETDEIVNKKIKACLKIGLKPVLCIGEKKRDEAGNYLHFVRKQIEFDLNGVNKKDLANIAIAYEPIWAIGKSARREALPEECREIVIFIKKTLADMFGRKAMEKVRILYGGSVNKDNARDFVTLGQASGLLVGRESLNAKNFFLLAKSLN